MKTKCLILIMTLLLSVIGKAQALNQEPQMADAFRSNGKIYVVIAVLSITFLCLMGYLIYIDLKVKKLESKK